MDIETLIVQLRQYGGYLEQAARCLEQATQVGGIRRPGRPRKLYAVVDRPKLEPVSNTQSTTKSAMNSQKGRNDEADHD